MSDFRVLTKFTSTKIQTLVYPYWPKNQNFDNFWKECKNIWVIVAIFENLKKCLASYRGGESMYVLDTFNR